VAIVLDPIIATGGTAVAAIQTLREWGAVRVVVLSVLGSVEGVKRVAEEADEEGWKSGESAGRWRDKGRVQVWVGAVDEKLDQKGMIVPGVGDVGDRLFGTKGK
jgi:uracil phosphoribosyltransferase